MVLGRLIGTIEQLWKKIENFKFRKKSPKQSKISILPPVAAPRPAWPKLAKLAKIDRGSFTSIFPEIILISYGVDGNHKINARPPDDSDEKLSQAESASAF